MYFGDETEKNRALTEMQGMPLGSKAIKLNVATRKFIPNSGVDAGAGALAAAQGTCFLIL